MSDANPGLENRVLVLAPTGKDSPLVQEVLGKAGLEVVGCRDPEELVRELNRGAGAALLAEEAMFAPARQSLAEFISHQPPWSDLPVLVLTRYGADSSIVADSLKSLGNVTLLERPIRISALVSALHAALRARQRQYQIRAYIAARNLAEAALQDADRRKDEFLATLAHELRNPLAPLSNSLHLLRVTADLDPRVEAIRGIMERQVHHLVRLVDDLLEVSRITRGKIELRKERVELAQVISGAVETSRPLLEAAGHDLALEMPAEAVYLDADPVRLTQVFANLLNNSAKYAERPGRVRVAVRREHNRVKISVRDSGIGIAADVLPHVFEMFMQGNNAPQRAHGGLGIGLTLVQSLVRMHGGDVEAFSEGLGRGSEFVVNLPFAQDDGTPQLTESRRGDDNAPAPRRILVVDDNRDAANSLGQLLRRFGAEVEIVHAGAQVLDAMAVHCPEVVLLDIGMPDLNGYEVARRIRRDPRYRDLLLIALTGWGQDEDRLRSRDAGYDHHLVKPVAIETLLDLLRVPAGGGRHSAG